MINATEVIDDVANGMYADRCQWQTAMFGHRVCKTIWLISLD